MSEIETFAASLQQYTPAVQIVSDPDEPRNYAVDGVLPRLTVIPETVEQVAQIGRRGMGGGDCEQHRPSFRFG